MQGNVVILIALQEVLPFLNLCITLRYCQYRCNGKVGVNGYREGLVLCDNGRNPFPLTVGTPG